MSVNDALDTLIKKYADLDMFEGYCIVTPTSRGPDGDTPFHMVAYDGDVKAAELMLPLVSNIDLVGDMGNTPLHYAVMKNQVEMVRFLIKHGADLKRANDYGDTPLDYMEGNEQFAKITPS